MGFADRLSLRTVATDYWRSVRVFNGSDRPDYGGRLLIFGIPVVLAVGSVAFGLQLSTPTAVLPAVALLAGVLLAAAGQILTMRARIADSLTLSSDERVTRHIRETMSGVLLAAVGALVDALLLGVLGSTLVPGKTTALGVVMTGGIVLMTSYVSLMFVATARRLYATYLEVFEKGMPLRKPVRPSAYEVREEKRSSKQAHSGRH